jgi:hypothetical protein
VCSQRKRLKLQHFAKFLPWSNSNLLFTYNLA